MHFRNHTMNSGCIEAAEGGSKKLCQNYEWAKNNINILIEYLFGSTLCNFPLLKYPTADYIHCHVFSVKRSNSVCRVITITSKG